jgi:hypothetical protein
MDDLGKKEKRNSDKEGEENKIPNPSWIDSLLLLQSKIREYPSKSSHSLFSLVLKKISVSMEAASLSHRGHWNSRWDHPSTLFGEIFRTSIDFPPPLSNNEREGDHPFFLF